MGAHKRYKVIDHVQEAFFTQWIGSYVQKVLRRGKVDADTVEIIALDATKRFVLKADGKDYVIRNWELIPTEYDDKDRLCGCVLEYTLFDDLDFDLPVCINGTYTFNEGIVSGELPISWNNNLLSEDHITYRHEVEEYMEG